MWKFRKQNETTTKHLFKPNLIFDETMTNVIHEKIFKSPSSSPGEIFVHQMSVSVVSQRIFYFILCEYVWPSCT